ncbi:MAG: Asp-tRNA(Asn)/Glu-tRNA(Gln) amidotransferase subunit GatB [Bacteroidota bacterium]|nr:Asp-tRNA(Asn)/Glu-tRNA(Gln) amidotransferase subunit GatB [Bacteroidota bacterium]MDX5447552.1 Asp-tRNA(Asn)/Glu-tRNA(Gln) amidotransferase subunit GatB [Bacteroidota bacterium]MDX5504555.1 Asp-tRNA(Asn)/Glu-tRNA(Gln) amidotransferase subunit GatB [Bacteroidota bacterium]
MTSIRDTYESVIGLEIHVQLNTNSKAYSSDATTYGEPPNTNISPISLGHPGTLPRVNEKVIEYAVRLGLATHCEIREWNEYARKNYFYADLPKGYQITQHNTPICTNGHVEIKDADGNPKTIGITRIHMEEDSGKSIHDIDPFYTLIDLNRAGVPLLEMVSEPDFRNGEEAYNYLTEMRKLVRYLDISDGNMEEGSLRCDVNVSVRKKGAEKFGTKVEVKNLNSFRNVQKAIDHEIERQIELIENGGTVVQETRNFDPSSGRTVILRTKEDAHDYRYFTEPDLQPVVVKEAYIEGVRQELPPLPKELFEKYVRQLGLSEYDAQVITENKDEALYFEELITHTSNYKAAANWMMGAVKSHLNNKAITILDFPISASRLAEVITLVDEGKVSNTAASQRIFPKMIESPEESPLVIAQSENLIQESDSGALQGFVVEALAKFPDKVQEYRNGKKGLIGLFMGEVMKLSKGKADPKVANQLVREALEKED